MTDQCVAPPETTLTFPGFVGVAIGKLPRFLEAINAALATVDEIRYSPSTWSGLKDPPSAEVVFELKGNSSITFRFKSRPVTEGSLAGYLRISDIAHRVGFGGTREDIIHTFTYLEHHCSCPHCDGMKYPFLPEGVPQVWFERSCNENRRLLTIRQFVGRLDC